MYAGLGDDLDLAELSLNAGPVPVPEAPADAMMAVALRRPPGPRPGTRMSNLVKSTVALGRRCQQLKVARERAEHLSNMVRPKQAQNVSRTFAANIELTRSNDRVIFVGDGVAVNAKMRQTDKRGSQDKGDVDRGLVSHVKSQAVGLSKFFATCSGGPAASHIFTQNQFDDSAIWCQDPSRQIDVDDSEEDGDDNNDRRDRRKLKKKGFRTFTCRVAMWWKQFSCEVSIRMVYRY